MDVVQSLQHLDADWIIECVSPPATPGECRPAVRAFAKQHKLYFHAPLRAPIYYVRIAKHVRVEEVGWVMEDVARAALREFERRDLPSTPSAQPPPATETPEQIEARRARAIEIQRIQEQTGQ